MYVYLKHILFGLCSQVACIVHNNNITVAPYGSNRKRSVYVFDSIENETFRISKCHRFTKFLTNQYCLEIFHSMICISGCHALTRKKAGCTSGCYTGTCRSIFFNKKKHALCCGAFQVKQHGWKPHLCCCLFDSRNSCCLKQFGH